MSNKLPYEFHVTVEAARTDLEAFRVRAQELGAKAIVLDLGINNQSVLQDVMTSSTMKLNSDAEALEEVGRIDAGLQESGFSVIRRKIESVPWHPLAPQVDGDEMPDGCYFESHMAVLSAEDEVSRLRAGVADTELHISRSAFKGANELGQLTIMATLRDYHANYEQFGKDVEASMGRINELGFELGKKTIVEFALYDTNTHQDDAWMRR
jgi:hypothetical protein